MAAIAVLIFLEMFILFSQLAVVEFQYAVVYIVLYYVFAVFLQFCNLTAVFFFSCSLCSLITFLSIKTTREVCMANGGIGSGETLCHDIYPVRPITTVSLATDTYCMIDGHSSCAPRTMGLEDLLEPIQNRLNLVHLFQFS